MLWVFPFPVFFFLKILEGEGNAPTEHASRLARIAFLFPLFAERLAKIPAFPTHIKKYSKKNKSVFYISRHEIR